MHKANVVDLLNGRLERELSDHAAQEDQENDEQHLQHFVLD